LLDDDDDVVVESGTGATGLKALLDDDDDVIESGTGATGTFAPTGLEALLDDVVESMTGTAATGIVAPTALESLLGDVIDSTGSTGTAATGTSQELKPEEEATPDSSDKLDEDWYVWNSVPNDAFGGLRGSVRGWDSGWRR